jgi:hypothetical protein
MAKDGCEMSKNRFPCCSAVQRPSACYKRQVSRRAARNSLCRRHAALRPSVRPSVPSFPHYEILNWICVRLPGCANTTQHRQQPNITIWDINTARQWRLASSVRYASLVWSGVSQTGARDRLQKYISAHRGLRACVNYVHCWFVARFVTVVKQTPQT